MKTNPRLKSLLSSSIVLFILFGLSVCSSPDALAENVDASISRSVVSAAEIRETVAAIEAVKKIEYDKIYTQVMQQEQDRIADPNSTQSKFVNFALKFQGTPYWYGGSTPSGFDCSGFVGYVLKHELNIDVRHSATSQMAIGNRVSDPLPGDLVGWGYGVYFHHIGIYIGDGKVIDALNPYRDLYVRDLSTLNSWLGKPTFTRVIEKDRDFNPHQITENIMNNKASLYFNG